MKCIKPAGIVLIVPGTVALAYRGITHSSRNRLIEIGLADTKMLTPLPP